ncbi:MAG: DUF3782 domain-containing protein [Desulfohalobiaceae bacterium]|nr:DUF3782 domain-containing protein [Desulfohalobiaceae bacterium]
MLEELKRDREAGDRKWEAQEKKWEENQKQLVANDKKWEENQKKWEESQRRWESQEKKWEENQKQLVANDKKWEENQKKWEESQRRWEAQEKKWEENQKTINSILKSIQSQEKKYDSTIGALGARWGIHSEAAFRNGLKAILEDSFDVTVKRYEDYDHEGQVFGRPDQIEMDLIIHNGTLILCEIKSSMDKGGVYLFWRKKTFYEQKHGIEVSRAMVISPMIDDPGKRVAQDLGIETYSYADSVKLSDDK